jgi:hypothetical protein
MNFARNSLVGETLLIDKNLTPHPRPSVVGFDPYYRRRDIFNYAVNQHTKQAGTSIQTKRNTIIARTSMLSKKNSLNPEKLPLATATDPSVGTYSSTQNTLTNFFRKQPKAKKSELQKRLTKDFANKTAGECWSPWKSKA